ncbi:MAG: 2'-5' RNA ligase family protein [Chitinophagaceae bacterium]|nr:2'-5' RNA ligase family protein [Chitinophagaceae bacterium]
MEKNLNPAENGLHEYLLIVSPAKEVFERVMQEKNHFSKTYTWPAASKALPHITVSNFIAWNRMEDTLIRWMQRIVADQNSFSVTVNNYSGFPSHTVFLSVLEKNPFKELATRLKVVAEYIKHDNPNFPVRLISKPHITIARGLSESVYQRAIKEYASKNFISSFNVTRLELLKRSNGYEKYNSVAQFYFKPTE